MGIVLPLCRANVIPGRRAPDRQLDLPHLSISSLSAGGDTVRNGRQNPGTRTHRGESRKRIALADVKAMPFEWMFVGDDSELLVSVARVAPRRRHPPQSLHASPDDVIYRFADTFKSLEQNKYWPSGREPLERCCHACQVSANILRLST